MIAMTFLSIGLLAVAQLIPLGMGGVTQARVRTNAVQAAQQQIDILRAADIADVVPGNYTLTDGQYNLAWTVVADTPVPGVKRIDLTASWQHYTGTKTVSLTTHVTGGQ
jgi:Tfp pilus assembly protein PilV